MACPLGKEYVDSRGQRVGEEGPVAAERQLERVAEDLGADVGEHHQHRLGVVAPPREEVGGDRGDACEDDSVPEGRHGLEELRQRLRRVLVQLVRDAVVEPRVALGDLLGQRAERPPAGRQDHQADDQRRPEILHPPGDRSVGHRGIVTLKP